MKMLNSAATVGLALFLFLPVTVLAANGPGITSQPQSQSILTGSNAVFTVVASGQAPLGYQWSFNGTNLADNSHIHGATAATLTVSNITVVDGGNYQVLVSNSHGSIASSNATLTVLVPAAITGQPLNRTTYFGGSASFSVSATGTAPLVYRWYFNGAPLADGGQISGSSTAVLNISAAQAANIGNYKVTVTNNYGAATSQAATLSVTNAIHYVNVTGSNPVPPYLDWTTAATNIQDAVDASYAGDQVIVTNGTYTSGSRITSVTTNCVVVTNAISISSVSGPSQTVIDGGGTNRCVYLAGGASLTGFTLTGGITSEDGAGLYCQSINELVANCVITGNTGGQNPGGGAYQGTLTNCTVTENWANVGGGVAGAILNNCLLESNSSYGGAGAFSCTMTNCTVIANSASTGGGVESCAVYNCMISNNVASAWGGGAWSSTLYNCFLTANGSVGGYGAGAKDSTLISCVLSNNTAYDGGGAFSSTLTNCVLIQNTVFNDGGGADDSTLLNCMVLSNSAPYGSGGGTEASTLLNCPVLSNGASADGGGADYSIMTNCLLAGNSAVGYGGGAHQSTLINCTIAENSTANDGGGVDSSALTNCIVYFNTSPANGNYSGTNYMGWCCTTPLPNASSSDTVIGTNNISSAPALVDPTNGNFRLSPGSPCIDAGNPAAVSVTVDLDGNPRTVNGTVDLGAYESQSLPFIVIQPTNQTAPFGTPSVSFVAVAVGTGVLDYQWQFNGANILGATNSLFTLNSIQYNNAGTYSLVVTNSFGATSSSNAVLTVVPPTPPSFTTQPPSQAAPVGTNIILTALATGAPAPAYQWYFNGTPLLNGPHYNGTAGTNLEIFNVQTNDSGNYFAIATNVGGAATSSVAAVTVFIPATILLPPVSQTLPQGTNVIFTATASGSSPLSYQWFFNGNPLTDGGQFSGTDTTNLTVSNLQFTNTGSYVLVVTNNYSSASAAATLTVLAPPVILSGPTNQMTLSGKNITFTVSAIGTAPLNYNWYSNGIAMANGGRISGATSAALTISTTQTNDAAAYQVIVTNLYGSATSSAAALTVITPIQIISQPSSQDALLGTNITFNVTAGGSGPLFYQWYLNGVPLSDGGRITGSATFALGISGVQSNDAGGYRVVVSNLLSSATSLTASLTPQSAPGPSVRYVMLTSTNPLPPYLNWSTAATNIQDAIDAAVAGDSIVVSNGVYNSGGRLVYGTNAPNRVVINKPITVQSLNGPAVTTIVGFNTIGVAYFPGRCVYLTNGAYLSGFTLTRGGGGNAVTGDTVHDKSGGGAWCEGMGAVISNCVIFANTASGYGGGAFGGTLFNCLLATNTAVFGSGAASNILFNCSLQKNTGAEGPGNQVSVGGGVYNSTLSNCVLAANTAVDGGGAYGGTLFSCILNNNTASDGGGTFSNILYNCILANNLARSFGGGAYNSILYNCTVVSNTANAIGGPGGGGINGGAATNSIIYYNAGNDVEETKLIAYTCTTLGGFPGSITNPPLFVNLINGNFHLQSNSPCINSGKNAYVIVSTDLDGNPRIVGGTVDMGAYEYQTPASVISYAWLQQYGLPTDGSVDFADLDGTAFNVYQDYLAGLNPTNSASVLQANLGVLSPGITILWPSVSTRNYYVQRSTNLVTQPFITIQSFIAGHTGTASYTDTTATNGGPYFYRVGIQLP